MLLHAPSEFYYTQNIFGTHATKVVASCTTTLHSITGEKIKVPLKK